MRILCRNPPALGFSDIHEKQKSLPNFGRLKASERKGGKEGQWNVPGLGRRPLPA